MNSRRTTIAGITGTPAEKRRDKEKKKKEREPILEFDYVQEPFYARAESKPKPKPKPKGPAVTVDESALPPKRAKQPTTVISGGGRRGPKNPSGRIVKEYSNPPRKVKTK